MDDSFADRHEAVQQALHSAKQQINILNSTVAHLTAENGDLQHELATLTEKEKDDKVRLKSTSDSCQINENKVSDLTERLQLAVEGKELAEKKVWELTNQVAALQEKDQSDAGKSVSMVCACEADAGTLQLKLDHLQGEMEMKKRQLSEAVSDLQKAIEKNVNLKADMEEMGMEMECLQGQLSCQSNVIQCQREELEGLRSQAESSSVCVDTNRKGNSLFSEVEDRRVMAETKMVKTMDKVTKLENRLKKEQKENQRLKTQVSLLMRSSNKASDKTVRALEQELEDSKRQTLKLAQQLAQQPETTKRPPVEPVVVSSQPLSESEVNMVTYLKATVANLQKEREEAVKEKNNLNIQNIQLDFLWTQKKNEVRSLAAEKERLASLTAHQALVIESLKSESDSNEEGSQPREMIKITGIDGSKVGLDQEADGLGLADRSGSGDKIFGSRKENVSGGQDLKAFILGTKSKSVAFSVDEGSSDSALTDLGNQVADDGAKKDGKRGMKLARTGEGRGGKYRSVTCSTMEDVDPEEQAPECNQQ